MNARLTHTSLSKRAGVSLPTRVASKRNTVARVSPEETQLIICSSTALCLAVGRFVTRPAGLLKFTDLPQNYDDAEYGPEASTMKALEQSNKDPAGFSIGDIYGFGGLGHVVGFAAIASLEF